MSPVPPRRRRLGQQRIWNDPDRPRLEQLSPGTRRRILRLIADMAIRWVRRPRHVETEGPARRRHDR